MFFQLIMFLLILLGTLYFSTQGIFSSLVLFACAAFASVLGMSTYEMASGPMRLFRPDYAHAVTFMAIFFVSFVALRFASGLLLPRNIPLPIWVDRIGGGVIGFFNSLLMFGTLMIAICMLPGYQAPLGYERYPDGAGRTAEGEPKPPVRLWIPADDFTVGLWNVASGGSLGGDSFAKVHPDFLRQLYGYRHTVQYESHRTVPPDLVKLEKAFYIADAPGQGNLGVRDAAGHATVVARLVITKGTEQPNASFDDVKGNVTYLHTTPTQVSLVTDKGHLYFPTGYMADGAEFTPLDAAKSVCVDDYNADKVVQDWVFTIDDDENPTNLEYKQFAKFDLSTIKGDKAVAFAPHGGPGYPQKPYLQDAPLINIFVKSPSGGEGDVNVVFVSQGVQKRAIVNAIDKAYDGLKDYNSQVENDNVINQYLKIMSQDGPDSYEKWNDLVNMMVYGSRRKVDEPTHYRDVMEEAMNTIKADMPATTRFTPLKTDSDGHTTPRKFAEGGYAVFAWKVTTTKFLYWSMEVTAEKKKDQIITLDTEGPTFSVTKSAKAP